MSKNKKDRKPSGYTPMTKEEIKKVRTVLTVILTVVAIGVVLLVYFSKNR